MGRVRKSVTEVKVYSTGTKLDAALYKRLECVAEKKDLTLSQVVRMAIRDYVDRFEKSRKIAA